VALWLISGMGGGVPRVLYVTEVRGVVGASFEGAVIALKACQEKTRLGESRRREYAREGGPAGSWRKR